MKLEPFCPRDDFLWHALSVFMFPYSDLGWDLQ